MYENTPTIRRSLKEWRTSIVAFKIFAKMQAKETKLFVILSTLK